MVKKKERFSQTITKHNGRSGDRCDWGEDQEMTAFGNQ